MTTATITVDRELVQRSFRDWQAEQAVLDAQLLESVAALEAYQSHLDGWQRQLAQERDELQRLREELSCGRAIEGVDREKLQRYEQELFETRTKLASLTSSLLERTEELRQLDRGRSDLHNELAISKTREKDLAESLEAAQKSFEVQRAEWETAIAQMQEQLEQSLQSAAATPNADPGASGSPSASGASPVLGSLMEQFDKLRQQRSVGRLGPNRTR